MSTCSMESEDQWSATSSQEPLGLSTSPGSSPIQQVPNMCPLAELIDLIGIPGVSPYLKILEQPQTHYKFRYKSEMENSHGCLYAKSFQLDKTLPKTYPEVELFNYDGKAKIKCQLVQSSKPHYEHPYKLCVSGDEDIVVDVPVKDNYRVRFRGLCIIHTARLEVTNWLYRGHETEHLSIKDKMELRGRCEKLAKIINLNSVRLKFSAHDLNTGAEICDPVYSDPIKNLKNPSTNILKICRLSRINASARGGDEVIMLVEKVIKKNIKIRFFEMSEDDDETWSAYANFMESDVHHQYAIAFQTPPYRDINITDRVKVYVQLVRPTDGERSEPKEFYYTSNFPMAKKRKFAHREDTLSSSGSYTSFTNFNPEIVNVETTLFQSTQPAPAEWQPSNIQTDMTEVVPNIASPMLSHGAPVTFTPSLTSTTAAAAPEEEYFQFVKHFDSNEYFSGLLGDLYTDVEGVIEPQGPMEQRIIFDTDSPSPNQMLRMLKKAENSTRQHQKKHGHDDQIAIQKMVKLLQSMVTMIKEFEANKKGTLAQTLEAIFDVRLSNGDTFLHLILPSKQPVLDYVVDLVHESGMTHLLNLTNASMQTILHLAVVNDMPDLIAYLLSKGCDPMIEDIEGNNVIHYAVMYEACLESLLSTVKKFNIHHHLDAYNNERQTPLHRAVQHDNACATRLLLRAGADALARDARGCAPLPRAARTGALPVLRALLDYVPKENIDDVDGNGYTALQIICDQEPKEDSIRIAKLLLDNNADPLKKREGHNTTAWGLARDKPELRDLMRHYLSQDPGSSADESSDDEFESADEGDFGDQDDPVSDLTRPLDSLSLGVTPDDQRATVQS